MKLFYSTGTSSTTVHVAMKESGLNYTPVEVSWSRGLNVAELEAVNPLGTVPVLVLDNGKILTQNVAILEYIADQVPAKKLIAAPGTFERNETMSWLVFAAADLQKAYGPLFSAEAMTKVESAHPDLESFAKKRIGTYLRHLDESLKGREFITGSHFTVADIYLHVMVSWSAWFDISLNEYRNLSRYMATISARPAVHQVFSEEGLLD